MSHASIAKRAAQLIARVKTWLSGNRKPQLMTSHFDQIAADISIYEALSQHIGLNGFFGQEVLRFYSIAGTLKDVPTFTRDAAAQIGERQITHPLIRTLIENFFQIMYFYDDPTKTVTRWSDFKTGFMRDYGKMYNEPLVPKANLEPAGSNWHQMPQSPPVSTVVTQLRNLAGTRLTDLYLIYRVASFDTHGTTLTALIEDVFQKSVNFPVLNVDYAIEMIASEYIDRLRALQRSGII